MPCCSTIPILHDAPRSIQNQHHPTPLSNMPCLTYPLSMDTRHAIPDHDQAPPRWGQMLPNPQPLFPRKLGLDFEPKNVRRR
jgi:hypothetical protein